jgi:hypothetical protein
MPSQPEPLMLDPFNRSRLPPEHATRDPARARRVRWIAEVAIALLEGRLPSAEARLFVAASLQTWLEIGGELVDDHLQVRGPRGSHASPQRLWQAMQRAHRDEGRDDVDSAKIAPDEDLEIDE